jgi:hypothetical protein
MNPTLATFKSSLDVEVGLDGVAKETTKTNSPALHTESNSTAIIELQWQTQWLYHAQGKGFSKEKDQSALAERSALQSSTTRTQRPRERGFNRDDFII